MAKVTITKLPPDDPIFKEGWSAGPVMPVPPAKRERSTDDETKPATRKKKPRKK